MSTTIIIKDSNEFNHNDPVVEIRWKDRAGKTKVYILKKTKNDVLATDLQKCYIKLKKSIGL